MDLTIISDFFAEYSPIIIGTVSSIGIAVGTVVLIWSKVKPIFTKLQELKTSVTDKANETDPFKVIQMETSITDLKAKLDNPTISDALKLQYLTQLNNLEKLLEATNTTIDSATDKVDNYKL